MDVTRIPLDYAVNQIFEWNHGRTNIDYGVVATILKHGGAEADTIACKIDTNTARTSGLVHPCALVVEETRLSIACTLEDTLVGNTGLLPEEDEITAGIKSGEAFTIDPMFFSMFSVRPDRAGSASLSVTTTMKMYDKGEKAVTTYFWFRNGLLHKVR